MLLLGTYFCLCFSALDLDDVYMDEDSYYTLVELIREKKNVIFAS